MGNYNFATIRVQPSFARATEETERLFAGLEQFANLGDSYEEYCEFALNWPTFCPVTLLNWQNGERLGLVRNESCHQLAKVFRDYLGSVWRRDPNALRDQTLKILLGLERKRNRPGEEDEPEWPALDASSPETLADTEEMRAKVREYEKNRNEENRSKSVYPDFDSPYRRALYRLVHSPERRGYTPAWPQLSSDWERGEFNYEPSNDFQQAVYRLFRQSWRARICRQCQRFFVARKHPQMFCGDACSTEARRNRDRIFWKEKGAKLRSKRNRGPRRGK